MKPNINDQNKLQELKQVLADKKISNKTINSIEKALKSGMVFKNPGDLAIVNLGEQDIAIIAELVVFEQTLLVPKDVKTFEFTFQPVGPEKFFFGYQFVLSFVNKNNFTIEESFPIEGTGRVYIDIDLEDILTKSKISYRVKSPHGEYVKIALGAGNNILNQELLEIQKADLSNTIIKVAIDAPALILNPSIEGSYQIKGRLLSNKNDSKSDGYQIVILASIENLPDGTPEFNPVAFAETETNGYFITSFLIFTNPADIGKVIAAKARITKGDVYREVPIKLVETIESEVKKSMLPSRLILAITENNATEECKDCGCNELNFHEKKVLEEYSYYTVVRTTEPSIIADVLEDEDEIDIGEIYGTESRLVPFGVFKNYQNTVSKQINFSNFNINDGSLVVFSANVRKPSLNTDLLEKIEIEHKVKRKLKEKERVFKGRTALNQINQIDWDKEATIYQAASIAHGHLLQFKQEWIPDGYSIGDLLYSLPLAPGQKKQIAVLDWERRESAANSQSLDFEENLNNSLVRDRDVNEVISATLNENIVANSTAKTRGIGGGFGRAISGSAEGISFGSVLGISGGSSKSSSSAEQSSSRESTANSFQSIRDRTTQAANAVRSQRATVIQTVSQGERVQATSESVANYNHCHAITIQYFEVLRHFIVQNRIASVQECLFVPLQITPFDIEKALRWRNSLEKHLLRPDLSKGFEAIARIQNEKESPIEQYYDSIGFPRVNYAEQNIKFLSGELYLEFYFFNSTGKIDDTTIADFKTFNVDFIPFKDIQLTDKEFAEIAGSNVVEFILNLITIDTDKGTDLKLDVSLVSAFRQNARLRVSLRQTKNTPTNIARNQIDAINIRLDESKVASPQELADIKRLKDKYMKIKVRSGSLRYRTDNFSGTLFSGRIDNDLFVGDDAVFLPALLTPDELRNPRGEDVDAANNLLHHFNENIAYYHKCIWYEMSDMYRFMLLDGIVAPGKANGRSVASVVENRIIGIAGNSLILPVAPGNQLDPTIDETFNLFAQYYREDEDPMRISMPTKGVFAEAVIGKCNSCEVKDESRFWRWEEAPIPDSPTTPILPLNTDSRRADPGDLDPKDFPNPVVNIQNAPNLPDPTGLQGLLQLLGKGDAFRDLTGLNQNQLNALATFQKSLDTAQAFGKEASELAKAAGAMKLIEEAQQKGIVSNEEAKQKSGKVIDSAIPPTSEDKIARAKEQIGLIDALQQQKGITSEDAQIARKQIIDNLIKGTGSNETSVGELGGLIEKSSTFGVDVKKDGESFELTQSAVSNSPRIVDVNITPSLRAFGPPDDRTGKTKLSVKASNAPPNARLVWSIPPSEAGNYTITQRMSGNISEVEITGIRPGLTAIDIELIDGNTVIQSEKHALSIPQFIRVDDDNVLFDDFLNEILATAFKDVIISEIKQVAAVVLAAVANVRLVHVSNRAHKVPDHIDVRFITDAGIYNSDPSGRNLYGVAKGRTSPGPVGDTEFNDVAEVYPSSFKLDGVDSNVDVRSAFNQILQLHKDSPDDTIKHWLIKFTGRLIGETLCHEIYHTLLPVPFNHNPSVFDIMDDGSVRSFTSRTGIIALSTPPGEFVSHLEDLGIQSINKLRGTNKDNIDRTFPVPPAPLFTI
ncbi:MAG: hypothetical protein DYG98_24230 [Haliscomenobacteraceae bacterium CHB4]|nr:hypothetical protein [Saprospiraceae bacterium]MCE7926166.1 hypothetical protein [Haliscomenobacteraceae bacterium CHB4]